MINDYEFVWNYVLDHFEGRIFDAQMVEFALDNDCKAGLIDTSQIEGFDEYGSFEFFQVRRVLMGMCRYYVLVHLPSVFFHEQYQVQDANIEQTPRRGFCFFCRRWHEDLVAVGLCKYCECDRSER